MDTSKNNSHITQTLVICIIFACGGYLYYQTHSVCNFPIQYSVGEVDSRFKISRTEVLEVIDTATKIWETPTGSNLFEYNPEGKLKITMIYDERQEATEKRKTLEENTEILKNQAKSVQDRYKKLEADFDNEQAEYEALLVEYKRNEATYNQTVQYWNTRGGAPEAIYESLQQQKQSLSNTYEAVESKRQSVNAKVNEINAFMSEYNNIAEKVNTTIDVINEDAGREFQEGTYTPKTKIITIYEFSDRTKLLRVLAHELGHALSLDHNPNPESIMYELNKSNTLTASKEDIDSLKALCKL